MKCESYCCIDAGSDSLLTTFNEGELERMMVMVMMMMMIYRFRSQICERNLL